MVALLGHRQQEVPTKFMQIWISVSESDVGKFSSLTDIPGSSSGSGGSQLSSLTLTADHLVRVGPCTSEDNSLTLKQAKAVYMYMCMYVFMIIYILGM